MATARLTERRVDALKPRKTAQEARNRARAMLAAIRNGNHDEAAAPPATLFETVADEVFRRYARNWKPSTLKVNRNYYRNHILPWFEGRPIGDITAHDVRRWFASLHNTPVSADRSAPILSVIMRQAEIYGYRPEGTNPCAGIRRYRRQGRQRFMSTAEIRRLGTVLARHEVEHPQAAAIMRLPLLTGCRKDEIVALKGRFYREGNLFLPDGKTGPRTVWLSSAAHATRISPPGLSEQARSGRLPQDWSTQAGTPPGGRRGPCMLQVGETSPLCASRSADLGMDTARECARKQRTGRFRQMAPRALKHRQNSQKCRIRLDDRS